METIEQVNRLNAVIDDANRMALQSHCWYLDDRLGAALAPVIDGRMVVDLGGGDGSLAYVMLKALGAKEVLVVEKEKLIRPHSEAIQQVRIWWYFGYMVDLPNHRYWEEFPGEVAVLSFPPNNAPFALTAIPILDRCEYVVVLGQNDGRNACGTHHLWEYLTKHKLVQYIQNSRNDLLIYRNRPRPADQQLVAHEQFGLTN